MTAHLTEEEQLEALKRWWDTNGKATLVGIAVAVAGYFGWQGWQDHQRIQAENASHVYQNLVEASLVEPGQTLTEEKRATATHLAQQLKSDYGSSLYAHNAALVMAKLAVEANELDKAAEELNWVLSQGPTQGVALIARLRLARVQAAKGDFDQALQTLEGVEADTFAAAYAEVRGDIYLAQNKLDEARAAYQLAMAKLLPEQGSQRNLLQMKLDDLRLPAVDEEDAGEDKTESEADTGADA